MSEWSAATLRPLVGDLRQVASVRRVVFDDGAERGVRALAFSTGGGLDFSVLADRSMDIGLLSWQGIPLSWQSPAGFVAPTLLDVDSEDGRGFNRGFSGFLVTCGLSHIRLPRNGEPQHGRLPFSPAAIKAYGESWQAATPFLHCEGEITQARYGGEALRLHRRIEAPIGGAAILIRDTVENVGTTDTKQPMLYHFNLGYPAIMTGSTVELDGRRLIGPIELPDAENGLVTARTWPASGPTAMCVLRSPGGLAVRFEFDTDALGHLQLWHDLRPGVGVLSIEPCTSGRPTDGSSPAEAVLRPGERRSYRVLVSIEGNAAATLPRPSQADTD
ncbi:DUF4432 family protein [Mesorhizobium temperatum]|uniref:DUF4432 domain-containing protein n=1 Tax=Mesorhizobium temperatum TaxID=241416 RepID=A0A271LCI1_9HYPH|nr:DUF4432 family protein [Mesorhizobium temperatum]PAQ05010.1 hypothetical protein CIT26_32665 [Mesorhizobium temperatum]